MLHRTLVSLIVFAAALPAAAEYRSGPELLDAMLALQEARSEGVSDYAMDVLVMNHQTTQFFERAPVSEGRGQGVEIFRLVALDELQRRAENDPAISPADIQAYAEGLATGAGSPGGSGMPAGLAKAFRPGSSGAKPAAGPMALHDAEQFSNFVKRAEIVGRESVDGRNSYLVKADGLNVRQVSDGQVLVIRSISMWVDVEDLLMLKMRMEGDIEQQGQAREMTIEKLDRDHRQVPGSRMILPYTSIVRMGGLLGPKEQREMEEARVKLAELDQQMAAMPPQQKRMMQSMMGPQIDMMRKMVNGGAFEIETTVRDIRINQGLSGAFARTAAPAREFAAARAETERTAGTAAASGFGRSGAEAPARVEHDAETLRQEREACLQQKIADAQARKKKKKRFGKLLGAVGRMVGRHAGAELASDVSRVSRDVYDAGATAKDLEIAADALGISPDDIAACEKPASE